MGTRRLMNSWGLRIGLAAVAVLGGCAEEITAAGGTPAPDRAWSRRFGGPRADEGRSVTVDREGNVYVLGQVGGEVDVGGGPVAGSARQDIMLASYTGAGAYRWSRRFVAQDWTSAGDVTTDAAGNVYVVGGFSGTLDAGGAPLVTAGHSDVLVASFTGAGVPRWSRRFGGAEDDMATRVEADAAGNVYVLGEFSTDIDLGGGALASAGSRDVFLASLTGAGAYRWARRGGSFGEDFPGGLGVAADGTVTIGGFYNGTADYGGGPLPTTGESDVFVASYGADGAHRWSRHFGSAESERFGDLAVGARGEVYLVGVLRGATDFGGGLLDGVVYEDMFVASLDRDGAHRWSRRFGTAGVDRATGVALDAAGNVYVTGDFSAFTAEALTISLGGAPLVSAGASDLFVASYTADGAHRSSAAFGSGLTDAGAGIAVDARGNVFVTGVFGDSAPVAGSPVLDFGSGPLRAASGSDAFVAKLVP